MDGMSHDDAAVGVGGHPQAAGHEEKKHGGHVHAAQHAMPENGSTPEGTVDEE